MAAVSLSPAPYNFSGMSSRRVPLGDVPNAVNSPFRAVAAVASKRTRDHVEAQEDLSYDDQPQAKRQALENGCIRERSPQTRQPPQSEQSRTTDRRPTNSQPTAFQKRLLAAREGNSRQRVERQEKAANVQIDDVRQWQKHYKKLFPSFVFYFESLPEDVRASCSRHVKSLGAREEKFFSKEVTHVVTTRHIPTSIESKDPAAPSTTSTVSQPINQPRTINPSCLEGQSEVRNQLNQTKNKFTFEAPMSRKAPINNLRNAEPRKPVGNTDILVRARDMGMKIWPLEKLQRAVRAMFDVPNETQPQTSNVIRTKVSTTTAKEDREAELSRMLRNERINGPSDREAANALSELTSFKGYYIYVRDMDERTKPILVRDYPKPASDEYSEWPQFYCVQPGKCPFLPEADPPSRHELERAKAREEELRARAKIGARVAPRTRAAASRNSAEAETTKDVPPARPLQELRDGGNASMQQQAKMPTKELCPPPPISAKNQSPLKAVKDVMANTGTKMFGGEPAASGMQPSNITSAIRSQMISSTAAAPGAKAGTSKEVHGLKRKVLEKNSAPALTTVQTRQRSADPAGVGRAERTIPAARQSRRQMREPLIHIDEETTQSEEDDSVSVAEDGRCKSKQSQRETEKKNAKPGWCENCREKYDDFDDHIVGRKHRKFAMTPENWKDLDRLLAQLGRQLKESVTNADDS
ncbi:Cdc7p-Dbf4p kinase complex regulatory subunit [Lecanora helva]